VAEIQELVEALGEHLSRPVEVDDQQLRLVAHSAHGQDVDGVRAASILHRRAPDAVARWVIQNGLNRSTTPVRTSPVAHLGMSARICVALRAQGRLLGYLWIIERERPLDDAEMQEVARVAELVARALDQERSAGDELRHRHDALLGSLLGATGEDAARAADELLAAGALTARRPVVVLCGGSGFPNPGAPTTLELLEVVFEELRHRLPVGVARWVVIDGRVVMVVADEPAMEGRCPLRQQVEALLEEKGPAQDGERVFVGIGDPVQDLAATSASYHHARAALDVAVRVPGMGSCLDWEQLGIYQLLSSLPISEPSAAAELLHPALRDLITSGRHGELIQTLEVFLDLGGDARAASEQLHLHRTSVYQRLRRIEALTGMSLHDGQARLTLHASIKLARLIGVYAG
jgi:hypothetical protein